MNTSTQAQASTSRQKWLSDQSCDYSWPHEIQALWRSTRAAREACVELDELVSVAYRERRYQEAERLQQLAHMAWHNLASVEEYAAPIVAAWEGMHEGKSACVQ